MDATFDSVNQIWWSAFLEASPVGAQSDGTMRQLSNTAEKRQLQE